MKPVTSKTLDDLKGVEWFRLVGVRDTDRAIVLNSWYEALENCGSPEWQDLCLEAANQYCERVAERSPIRFQSWNTIVKEIKAVTIPLVKQRIDRVVRENDLPKVIEDCVQWDILHLCMEAEFGDVFPPGFYASQGFWYKAGHFPCGFRGGFPDGQIVVY